jgi:hypothetical protein
MDEKVVKIIMRDRMGTKIVSKMIHKPPGPNIIDTIISKS